MTNKLKYFVGNWKMFGDFSDFKIIHKINGEKDLSLFIFIVLSQAVAWMPLDIQAT